jgi:carboxyl-terminal processing protease
MHRYPIYLLVALLLFPVEAQNSNLEVLDAGVTQVTGTLTYTNPLFARGLSEPVVILEDIYSWFVDDPNLRLDKTSQILARVTAQTNRYQYVLNLPSVPQARPVFIANNPQALQVFAVSFWSNLFGDNYLEYRDQRAGGWSRNYSSLRFDEQGHLLGGRLLVYAPVEGLYFPQGLSEDALGLSETQLQRLAMGWTMVNLDERPFAFSRSAQVDMPLLERETSALTDFSRLSYLEAFDALLALLRREYAFTEQKDINWSVLSAEFRSRIEQAQTEQSADAFAWTLQELIWRIPDGHMSLSFNTAFYSRFQSATSGGIGLSLAELDDGRFIAWYVAPYSPAEQAGITPGLEIVSLEGVAIAERLEQVSVWSAPFSTVHVRRLQALRYVTRFPMGQAVNLSYRTASGDLQTLNLTAVDEQDSLHFSSFNQARDPFTPPIESRSLEGFAHIVVYDFADDARLTVQLWERAIQTALQTRAQGIIIDLRENTGGNLYLADMLAGYVHEGAYNAEKLTGAIGFYDALADSLDDSSLLLATQAQDFAFRWRDRRFMSSAPDDLLWRGKVAVLISPACASACEFFAYNLALDGRAEVFGMYPSAGMGGTVKRLNLPDGLVVQFTNGRAVDAQGQIHIEGQGVSPTQRIAVNAQNVFAQDAILEVALDWLRNSGAD